MSSEHSDWPLITELIPKRRSLDAPADLEAYYQLEPGPHLRVNFVASLDGRVEIGGRSRALGGPVDRAAFMAMRAVSDAVMVGAGTARAENYGPADLGPEVGERRLHRGQALALPLVVVTASCNLDPSARLFQGDDDVFVVTTAKAAASRPSFPGGTEILECGEAEVDLAQATNALRERGLDRILCEGGPALTRSLMLAGLVDELCLTISPLLAGSAARGLSAEGPPAHSARMELSGLLEGDSMLVARYRIHL